MTDTPDCGAYFHRNHHDISCSRRGVVEENGEFWCRQHAPSAVTARDQKHMAVWARKGLILKVETAKRKIAEIAIDMYDRHALKNTDEIEEAIEKYKELKAQLDD